MSEQIIVPYGKKMLDIDHKQKLPRREMR